MLTSHEGHDSLEASLSRSAEADSAPEIPAFLETSDQARADEAPVDGPPEDLASSDELVVRPLSESLLDEECELVIGHNDEAAELATAALHGLIPLLGRSEPLTWVIAGARMTGDAAFGDCRLVGEWFAEEWRAESGRATDLVIDATWPGCTLAMLKSHLKSRVMRHRPDVAILVFDRSDAGGIDELLQFERRLVAVLSMLAEVGAVAVLVQTPLNPSNSEIDSEIFYEAISGIARERGLACLELPEEAVTAARPHTPDSPARNCALFLCREAMRAF